MATLPIVQIKKGYFKIRNTSLRSKSTEVTSFNDELQSIIDDLIETLEKSKIAVGLSAPQVGILLRISLINLDLERKKPTIILINPKIISLSGKKDKKKESCLSIPGYRGEVERRYKVEIEAKDRFAKPQKIKAEGFLARVIQHEIDHLDGILYIDRMNDLNKLEPVDFF